MQLQATTITNREGSILTNTDLQIDATKLVNERVYEEIDVEIKYERSYKYRNDLGRKKTGHAHAWAMAKQRLYSDIGTKIMAGGNLTIHATQVGNGEKGYGISTSGSHSVPIVGLIVNHKNDVKQTGRINTENYVTIPNGDKGLFKIHTDDVGSGSLGIGLDFSSVGKAGIGPVTMLPQRVSEAGNPKFSYLIETNVKYIDLGYYCGSQYFFDRIGFSPERDIRLLGDAFYEERVVNRAILESTGRRYLNGAKDETEQMRILYDHSVTAMESLNLTIGVDLTAEQINNLKEDIIWYVEEIVNGVSVLVPKVYLSKETLASLGDGQDTVISGGGTLAIHALGVSNTGTLLGEKSVLIHADDVLNQSLLGMGTAKIIGSDITILAEHDIRNIGAEITADNNLTLHALHDITFDTIETTKNYGYQEGKKTIVVEEVRHIGSRISGGTIDILAEHDVNVTGSQVEAKKDLSIAAGHDVNVIASVDSNYRSEYESSGNVFSSKDSVKIDYSTSHNASNLIGENIRIQSGNDTRILGSNLEAGVEGSSAIRAGGDIVQAAVKDIDYHYEMTSSSSFFGLTGRSKSVESYKEEAMKSNTISGVGGTVYDARNDLVLEGVTIVSTGDISLSGSNVTIKPMEELNTLEIIEKKRGFSGGLSGGTLSLSYGASKDEFKLSATTQVVSEVVGQGDVRITANDGYANLTSVDIYGKEGITISGTEGVNLLTAKDTEQVDTKHKSTTIGISIGVSAPIQQTINNIWSIG
jgi:filamentous hemagglutinin